MAMPISYYWRSLFVRKATTLMTVLVITAVVAVFAYMMGFADALGRSLSVASDDGKLIVIKGGATAESNSAIPIDDFNKLSQLTDVARDPETGQVLVSPEMLVQVSLPRLRDGGQTNANVAVRGVTMDAFKVHTNVRPEGALFSTAEREVIVGEAAAKQFGGLKIGDTLNLGFANDKTYKVVGYFTADGGPMESEIWGYLPSLMNSYNRTMYSSANLRLADGVDAAKVVEQIEGPAIQLTGQTETDYWYAQSRLMRVYLGIANALVVIMSIAAIFSVANTMFSVVAGRGRELAMLRTIGFSGRQILMGLVIESVMLSSIGGVLGCLGCWAWLSFVGNTKDMFGATTFTTMAFEIHMTPLQVFWALAMVCGVGVLGALVPAIRASRMQVVTALREA